MSGQGPIYHNDHPEADPFQTGAGALPPQAGPDIRQFETGANRDTAEGKLDFEGFLSPQVIHRFAEYMNKNRVMRDGTLRDSDNWQKGIPTDVYMKSLWRHFFDVWALHRDRPELVAPGVDMEEALCGLLFNGMGMLHEYLRAANNDLKASVAELTKEEIDGITRIIHDNAGVSRARYTH